MKVRVYFFASVRERVRRAEMDWELPAGATVHDLWQSLSAQYPQLQPLASSITFAVNQQYVARDHQLAADDEVAIIPPVSGGMDVSDRIRSD